MSRCPRRDRRGWFHSSVSRRVAALLRAVTQGVPTEAPCFWCHRIVPAHAVLYSGETICEACAAGVTR